MSGERDRAETVRLQVRVTELERLLEAQKREAAAQADRQGRLMDATLKQVHDQATILRTVVAKTAAAMGGEFFRALVTSLASALGVRCTFVGEVLENRPGHVRTLALWMGGALRENFDYALAGTPCEHIVTGRRMLVFPRGIRQQFPDDRFLADSGLESYMGFPLFDERGEVMGLVGVIHDAPMTDDSRAQSLLEVYASRVETELRRLRLVEALQESEEKYRLLFSRAMDAVVLVDMDTYQFLDVNDVAVGMYGYSRDEFLRLRVPDVSAEPAKSLTAIRQAAETGGAYVQLRWHKRRDGTVFPVEISGGPFMWKGRMVMCGVLRDITERRRAEEALRESEARFRTQYTSLPVPTYTWRWDGTDWVFVSYNLAAESFSRGRVADLIGSRLADLYPDRPDIQQDIARCFRDQIVLKRTMSYVMRTTEERKELSVTYVPVLPDLVMVHTEDLSARLRAEADLREGNARLQAILDHSPAMVFLKDTEGRYLLTNRQFERTFHLVREAVVGKTDRELFAPDQAEAFMANDRQVFRAGAPMEFEEVAIHDDGPHTSLVVKFPLRNEAGAVYAICGITADITERKRLEAQLRQAQKMEAIGRLAGGIAHDFNNLLTVINGCSDLLLREDGPDTTVAKHAGAINQAGLRAADLTRQLLAFSRRQVVRPKVLDLNGLVTNLAEMLRRLIGEDIRLATVLATEPLRVKADPGQLEQILMNLAVNARDAMPQGGTLTIETEPVRGDVAVAPGQGAAAHGPRVRLTIRDTGCGMDEATRAHIFEPFFTTKEQGKGTGLGLAMVYGIVAQCGGTVAVDSVPGQGAAFMIDLPPVSDSVEAEEVESGTDRPSEPQARGETILLVEDDQAVRMFVRRRLAEWGYEVLEAAGGEEALQLAGRHPGPIHLLLTDVVMPGMSGQQLAARVKGRWPGTNILFMSGYPGETVARHGLEGLGGSFLQKPFSPLVLQRTMRAALETTRQ